MKKTLVILLLLLFGITNNAFANKKVTCKKGTGETFTVMVPDGWASKDINGGCHIAKQDGSNHFISIAYYNNEGLNAKTYAERICKLLKTEPKYLTQEDNYTSMLINQDGLEIRIGIASEGKGEGAQVITQYPEDSEELDKIFDTVEYD